MARRTKLSLGVGSYESASVPFSAQRCVNMFAVPAQAASRSEFMLYPAPGTVLFSSVANGASRGAVVMAGVYYVIFGNQLYEISSSGSYTARGAIAGTERVSMAHNGDKLCIVVPGGKAYQYQASTTTLTEITDPDFRTADTVCFGWGYYIFTATAGDVFFISALNDPLTYNALDFGTAEISPDKIVSCHVSYDELYIFGSETIESFQNVGGSGFPFQRIQGASFEKGARSKYSPIQWEGSFYFVGGGRNERTVILRSRGTDGPSTISTDAIASKIQEFSEAEISRSTSFTYSVTGSSFVGFNFRSVNIPSRTFVYNVTASGQLRRPVWHELQTGVEEGAWRSETVDFVYDKLLVSDSIEGKVGYLDADVLEEYGETWVREKVTGPLALNGSQFFVRELELVSETGIGKLTGQGSDPQVMLSYSDDGARTFSSEYLRSLGKIGEYRHRSVWRRLGRCPSARVWKLRVTDPVKTNFIALEGRIDIGN
jgi:hypothetical protein